MVASFYFISTMIRDGKAIRNFPRIGIIDSGLGGISAMNELYRVMGAGHFLYYGDLANSPYGLKEPDEVIQYTRAACDYFVERGASAILVACNTATSASIIELRKSYAVPVFGMEPAIKPALLENPGQRIGVLATSLTLKGEKFLHLAEDLRALESLVPVQCDGLSTLVDRGDLSGARGFLVPIVERLQNEEIRSVVLGCTHYVLLGPVFRELYPALSLYDGNAGTARHIVKTLGLHIPIRGETRVHFFLNGGKHGDYITGSSFMDAELRRSTINQKAK